MGIENIDVFTRPDDAGSGCLITDCNYDGRRVGCMALIANESLPDGCVLSSIKKGVKEGPK